MAKSDCLFAFLDFDFYFQKNSLLDLVSRKLIGELTPCSLNFAVREGERDRFS